MYGLISGWVSKIPDYILYIVYVKSHIASWWATSSDTLKWHCPTCQFDTGLKTSSNDVWEASVFLESVEVHYPRLHRFSLPPVFVQYSVAHDIWLQAIMLSHLLQLLRGTRRAWRKSQKKHVHTCPAAIVYLHSFFNAAPFFSNSRFSLSVNQMGLALTPSSGNRYITLKSSCVADFALSWWYPERSTETMRQSTHSSFTESMWLQGSPWLWAKQKEDMSWLMLCKCATTKQRKGWIMCNAHTKSFIVIPTNWPRIAPGEGQHWRRSSYSSTVHLEGFSYSFVNFFISAATLANSPLPLFMVVVTASELLGLFFKNLKMSDLTCDAARKSQCWLPQGLITKDGTLQHGNCNCCIVVWRAIREGKTPIARHQTEVAPCIRTLMGRRCCDKIVSPLHIGSKLNANICIHKQTLGSAHSDYTGVQSNKSWACKPTFLMVV